MTKQGASSSRFCGNNGYRSPTPPPRDESPPRRSPEGSDEKDIMRAPIPAGFERPPPLGIYDRQTDLDEHIDNINAVLDFRMVS
ncbi:hypothetical protein A2U01_0081291, partial [Trifolium medium]|nr:hypothetical protein [Trifolium medium]